MDLCQAPHICGTPFAVNLDSRWSTGDREDEEIQAMQKVHKEIDRLNPDEDLCGDCDVPDEIDYWSITEFGDVLPADEPMAAEHY